jgi:hypothetical protein
MTASIYRGTALLVLAFALAGDAGAQRRVALRSGVAPVYDDPDAVALGAQRPPQRERRRMSTGGRVALQLLASGAGAVGGGIALDLALKDVSTQRVKGDEGYTRSANVGYLVGSFAGATLGAHWVGTSLGGKSPLWATALGSLVGTVPLAALGIDEPYLPLFGIVLGWIPQAALATGGFNMAESR